MAKSRPNVDLWDLFIEGCSGEIAFGETDVSALRRYIGVREKGQEGRLPYSSWILNAEDTDCFFQGVPGKLWSLKVRVLDSALSDEADAILNDGEQKLTENIGLSKIVFNGDTFSKFSTIHRFLKTFPHPDNLEVRSTNDKLIQFDVRKGERSLCFGYRPEMRALADNVFDFDYFLYAVWLHDFGADGELSKTLPEGTESRLSALSGIANAKLSTEHD